MANLVQLLPKLQGETVPRVADFISKLPPGVNISAAGVLAGVYSGNDPSPASIIQGNAVINGSVVSQAFTQGIAGTIYVVAFTAFGTDGNVYQLYGYLAVLGNPPAAQPGGGFILLPNSQAINVPGGQGILHP